MTKTPDTDGRATTGKDILIQVEEADVETKRKTRFADEEDVPDTKTARPEGKKAKVNKNIKECNRFISETLLSIFTFHLTFFCKSQGLLNLMLI